MYALLLVITMIFLEGCCGSCPPTEGRSPEPSDTVSVAGARVVQNRGRVDVDSAAADLILRGRSQETAAESSSRSAPSSVSASAVGPLAVGALIMGLRSLRDNIDRLLRTATGEIGSVLAQTQLSAAQLLDRVESILGDDISSLIQDLGETERRLAEDVEAFLAQAERAIRLVTSSAQSAAKIALHEADIAAYNALGKLPCADQQPRAVYLKPSEIRLGIDPPQVKVRGNYLAFEPQAKVNGVAVTMLSVAPNELLVEIPETVIETVASESPLVVEVATKGCKPGIRGFSLTDPSSQGLSGKILPPLAFEVTVEISGVVPVKRPYEKAHTFFEKGSDTCKDDRKVTKNYCLPATDQVQSASFSNIEERCGSGILVTPPRVSRNCVLVEGRVKGCGRNMFGLNCKGRGWLGYTLTIEGLGEEPTKIPTYLESKGLDDQTEGAFTFKYPEDQLPADRAGEVDWLYSVSLAVKSGDEVTVHEVSHANPNFRELLKSRIGEDGTLAVETLLD